MLFTERSETSKERESTLMLFTERIIGKEETESHLLGWSTQSLAHIYLIRVLTPHSSISIKVAGVKV